MEIKDLLKENEYKSIAIKLGEVAQSQTKLLEEISKAASLITKLDSFKIIESAIKELDIANSFKDLIAPTLINSPAIEFARQANKAISGLSITPHLNSILSERVKLSESWQKHLSSIESISLKPSVGSSLLGIQSQLARISQISLLAEKALSHINSDNFASLILGSSELKNIFFECNIAFSKSYTSLFKSLADKELSFLSHIPEVTILSPIEYFYNSRLLEAISIPRKIDDVEISLDLELSKETKDDLSKYLDIIDPDLNDLWKGAKEALRSSNPDAVRHFSVSLRELITHVIHKLSPDEGIRRWSTSPEYYYQNRPTRKARLLYICRSVNLGPFNTFIDKDIEALLAFLDLFQEGTHSVTSPFSDQQLAILLARTESAIRFLIKIWLVSKDN